MNSKFVNGNISFIIPAYNCERTISETIDSILKNIESKDEVVIVNDCSTDNTSHVIKQYADENSQIKIVEHPVNKGGAAARNTAVENASNELIFCLDSDNVLLDDTVPSRRPRLRRFSGAACRSLMVSRTPDHQAAK